MMEPTQRPSFPKLKGMLVSGDKGVWVWPTSVCNHNMLFLFAEDSRVPSPTMHTMLPARRLG